MKGEEKFNSSQSPEACGVPEKSEEDYQLDQRVYREMKLARLGKQRYKCLGSPTGLVTEGLLLLGNGNLEIVEIGFSQICHHGKSKEAWRISDQFPNGHAFLENDGLTFWTEK